jgi:hypothetical protein
MRVQLVLPEKQGLGNSDTNALKVVTTDRQDKIRVVTAFAPSAREANEYLKEALEQA